MRTFDFVLLTIAAFLLIVAGGTAVEVQHFKSDCAAAGGTIARNTVDLTCRY